MSSSNTAESPRRLGVVRDACSSVASFLANLLAPSDSDPANDDDDAYLSQQQQQQQQQQQLYAATTSSTTSAAAMLSASVALTAAQITNTNYFCTPAANAVFNSPKALELMRAYDAYVGLHKTRWHGAFLFLLAFLFFGCCTVRGWQYRGEITPSTTVADLAGAAGSSGSGSGGGSTGGGGGGGAGGGMDGMPGGVAGGGGTSGGLPGSAAAAAAAAGGGAATAGKDGGLRHGLSAAELSGHAGRTRRRYASLPALLRWALGWSDKAGQMALANVEWWPASNRTPDSADAWGERGLRVGTPNAASLSVARSQPPWSADARPGLIGALGRLIHYVTSFVVTPDPPPYELALRAFFRTRQAMTAGSCNRCHADVIERDVHAELARYQAFLRTNRMRVPLLLHYNRLPVFALLMHFRLMRVRNYQLLNYVSRPDAALRHPETVADDISGDARLHGRELDFELTRLAFVFYIQRLHLRAMRHADAMRLETLHFLRHLSTTVPALRALWVGQDHCKWQGVNCIVVHVPLNELIDEEHPSLVTLLADVYSVCRGSHCEQRRCPRGSCNVHVHSFVKSLFTEAIPAYWARWDRMDDTAAMDEMIFAKAAPKPPSDVEAAAAAAAAAAQQQQQQAGTPLQGGAAAAASASPTRLTSAAGFGGGAATHPDMNPLRADVPAMAHGSPAAAAAARTTRLASMTERTVWTEQQFAYDHPDLTLAEPALIIDIDVEAWMTKTLSPVTGDPVTLKDEDGVYRHDVERPLVEDLLPMQRKLLRTMAEAAPRGVRIGKQRATPKSRLTIPFTFVSLDLSQAGLRGYLPDYYDTASSYDVADAAAPAAATTARGSAGGKRTANGGAKTGGPDSGSLAEVDVDEDELAPGRGGAGARGRRPEVSIQKPRSDVYWGKLSRQRMLESRNLSYGFRSKRTVATVSSIAGDIRRVLRRVEKIGQRNNHEDLAAYFSEITAMAQFQNEKWSPYRWPEAMIAVTSAVVQSGRQRLYPILESNAFAAAQFPTPVRNIDHNVEAFGQINPRLVAVLSIDVTGNPQLAHTFPRTWMSLPYLQSVRTFGSSILAAPLRIRSRVYNQSYHCPPGSGIDVLSPYMEDGYRSRQLVMADAARDRTVITASTLTDGGSVTTVQTSLHDRDYVGSVLVPPFKKIDKFLPLDARDGSLDTADPLPDFEDLYRRVDNSFSAGFSRGLWSSLTEPLRTQQ